VSLPEAPDWEIFISPQSTLSRTNGNGEARWRGLAVVWSNNYFRAISTLGVAR